ncbi:SDR family NAD(P)-dependent oxidoreductase [Cyanobium sp. CH-040]|uniref:SDR family NAD(P)-dependent oxidoreductase n=1 Tax=Cyanobium sp. CH-040 TaxID=2823708 RepID=UPI0020CCAB63|nr:SDR family NAD(P)-dependent oxidoreductase [Cyanobium sp. CH-040]MCP9926977.1 SDR family NAD(P)-dependent oxidoreductase [Cyanobium sp. CH-040]
MPGLPAAAALTAETRLADWRLSDWRGRALVVGCGGIGRALLTLLAERCPHLERVGASRHPAAMAGVTMLSVDLERDVSLQHLAEELSAGPPLRLVIHTAGLLHDGDLKPEKRLAQVRRAHLERSFAVNAFAPLLLAKVIEPLLPRQEPFHFASLSARVGSIGDNRLGGWYAYRAAKAAQNQLLRTLALEWQRRLPLGCVSLLHPGTTATGLSAPFQANVPQQRLFSPERAAAQLLDVLERRSAQESGGFWAWDGEPIPW